MGSRQTSYPCTRVNCCSIPERLQYISCVVSCYMFLVLCMHHSNSLFNMFHVSGLTAVCRYFTVSCFRSFCSLQIFLLFHVSGLLVFPDALNLVSCFMSFEFRAFLYCTLRMLFRQKSRVRSAIKIISLADQLLSIKTVEGQTASQE